MSDKNRRKNYMIKPLKEIFSIFLETEFSGHRQGPLAVGRW